MQDKDFCIVIPCSRNDALFVPKTIGHLRRYYSNKIIVVTAKKNIKYLQKVCNTNNLEIVDEDTLLPGLSYGTVKSILGNSIPGKRPGWYFQQFLKYAFAVSSYCDSKYYLVWDSDTIPLTNIEFFENNHPLFNPKKEYHKEYFDTIETLLKLKKNNNYSYISEHLVFDRDIVKELLDKIEGRNDLNGAVWFEKILDVVKKSNSEVSFSEFETYGTYCEQFYPEYYQPRKLSTFREGGYISGRMISNTILWQLSFDLDTVSFENTAKPLFPMNIVVSLYEFLKKSYRYLVETF